MPPLRIIVTGLIAQHPHMGGVAWDYVQYPLGLRRLGHDVYYFEDSGEWPYNLDGGKTGDDWAARTPRRNLEHLSRIMRRFGLEDRWAYRFPLTNTWHGLSDAKRREIMETADLLINVSGTLEDPDRYLSIPRLAYIDSDPVFTQLKLVQDTPLFCPRVHLHDVHFTFGEALSAAVPATGHDWLPTRHPMLLDQWSTGAPFREVYTTVMNWTSYPPVVHDGVAYGQKDVEFSKFLNLPSSVDPARFEIALSKTEHGYWQSHPDALPEEVRSILAANPRISPGDLLRAAGWRVVDPEGCCVGLDGYRDYITSSKGEWSVAKNGYVQGRPGWFSCRSCCYLAAGRPVIVQDTGFTGVIPAGEGVLAFSDFDEAVEAVREVEGNYPRHARAAREIAAAYFDSADVLSSLVERAMESPARRQTTLAGSPTRGAS